MKIRFVVTEKTFLKADWLILVSMEMAAIFQKQMRELVCKYSKTYSYKFE
jgi:hypothetical protein